MKYDQERNCGHIWVTPKTHRLCEIVRYRRKEILDRLRDSFGHELISKLSFRIG